ncbi:hypothetical protein O1611_g4568 [Lasiodiplodia mahajangana]|uniref:Uncharacterized protein n=1 Tax=Lasiodiplodia mahajangana TaxID=1108764 RepID=A0ACC2JNN1_9PEZI|nr:hypothetical protein O1611_g4568 [Lasiodiplodia mahajangana]
MGLYNWLNDLSDIKDAFGAAHGRIDDQRLSNNLDCMDPPLDSPTLSTEHASAFGGSPVFDYNPTGATEECDIYLPHDSVTQARMKRQPVEAVNDDRISLCSVAESLHDVRSHEGGGVSTGVEPGEDYREASATTAPYYAAWP